jgi:hypothetical protein
MGFEICARVAARLHARARLPGVLLVISACAGCAGTPSTTITTDASHVFNPSLSVAVGLDDDKQPPSEPHSGHAIEMEAGRAKGSGLQTLASGQPPVVINNTTFNAPQHLRNDFDFYYADMAYRYRKFFGERQAVGIEAMGGIGYTSLGLAVSSSTQQDAGRFSNTAAKGSFAFIWRMRQSTSLDIRLSTFRWLNAFAGGGAVTSADRFELFLAQAVGDNLSLRLGYTSWTIDGSTGAGSDFHTTFGGPMANLGFNF